MEGVAEKLADMVVNTTTITVAQHLTNARLIITRNLVLFLLL